MQLVTFGINRDKNLIVQFPIYIQPYTEPPLNTLSTRKSISSNFRPK